MPAIATPGTGGGRGADGRSDALSVRSSQPGAPPRRFASVWGRCDMLIPMRAWLDGMGRWWIASCGVRRVVTAAVCLEPAACLGIEGTDVSTGAAEETSSPGSTGGSADDSVTMSASSSDPSGVSMATSSDPTTDDGESSAGGPRLDVGNDATDTTGPLGESSSETGDEGDTGGSSGTSGSSESGGTTESGTDTGSSCGDGEIQLGEDCEGVDLQGQTCISLNFRGGVLACDPTTCLFDTSACM